jgi:hypothetical protein
MRVLVIFHLPLLFLLFCSQAGQHTSEAPRGHRRQGQRHNNEPEWPTVPCHGVDENREMFKYGGLKVGASGIH